MNKKLKKRMFVLSLLVVLCFMLFMMNEKSMEVPYAVYTIAPRTKIDETMIAYKTMPYDMLDESIETNVDNILHKYNDIEGKIPQGSVFYKEMLIDEELAPDSPSLKLREHQTSYSLEANLVKSSGNTIIPGQKVDVYVSIDMKNAAPKVDCLLRNVRVLSVKDRNGFDVDDEQSSHLPGVILLAIDNEFINYLKVAEKIGTVEIMATSINYGNGKESVLNEESTILKYLQ